jgi:hypothetical protein
VFELQVAWSEIQRFKFEAWGYADFKEIDSGKVYGVSYVVGAIDIVYFVAEAGVWWCLFVDETSVDEVGYAICWLFLVANIILAERE